MKNPKLQFFIDAERDIDLLKQSYTDKKLTPINAQKIWADIKETSNGVINEKNIEFYVKKIYKNYGNFIKKSTQEYQSSWDKINKTLFDLILKKTNINSPFPFYKCHISAFFQGLSNWGGNIITRGWWENPFTMRKITAHELLIAYLWSYLRETFPKISENKIWAMSELTVWTILSYDEDFIKFWPWFADKGGLQNYPQLTPYLKDAKQLNASKKDFKEFLFSLEKKINLK